MVKRKNVVIRESAPILVLAIAVFLFASLAIMGGGIEQNATITGNNILTKVWDSNLITQFNEGETDVSFARWAFFLLGIIFFSSALKIFAPRMKGLLNFLVGIILSFLLVGYIVPGDLLAVLIAYNAVGLTLIAVIPFLILLFFTGTLLMSDSIGNHSQVILERFVWFFFFIFLGYKSFAAWNSGIDQGTLIILLIATLLSFAIFIWHNLYLKFISRTLIDAFKTSKDQEAHIEKNADELEHEQTLSERERLLERREQRAESREKEKKVSKKTSSRRRSSSRRRYDPENPYS